MRPLVRVFIALAGLLLTGTASSQVSSKGKVFYFSFMEMLTVATTGEPDSLLVFMTCDVNTKVTIDNPRVSGSAVTMNLVAGKINRYAPDPKDYYPVGSEFGFSSPQSKKCIRIVAKDPISVYCLNMEVVRTDGTFVLPYESIPKAPEFYITAFTPNRTEGSVYMPSEFVVVGMDKNVQVEITPTTRTAGGQAAGTPFTVTLAPGQVYQVQSHPDDGNTGSPTDPKGDLTGTRVRVINGCGKINVFAGMRTAKMPAMSCSTIDHLYTQVFPTSILGTKHVLMPFATQTGGYVFRVLATRPNTKIYIDGTYIGSTKAAGTYYYEDVTTAAARCITSDSPVYVVQYMKSSGCSGNPSEGDPAILIMPDQNQKMLKATVGTATTSNLNKHYVNILVSKWAKSAVKLNGTALSSSVFKDVACANQAYAQVAVSNPSSNIIECDSGLIVVAYGAGPTESYSYCAGALFENLEFDIKMTRASKCPNYPVTLQAVTNARNIRKFIWKFGDGFTDTGKTVVHSYKKTGAFYTVVSAIVPAKCGGYDTLTRSLIINILPGPLYEMPDTAFQCTSQLNILFKAPVNSKFLYKWQDSSSGVSFTAKNPGKVWLRITDTSTNCYLYDSTLVIRYNAIKAAISYDTFNPCIHGNLFSFSDKSSFNGDAYKSAKWLLKLPKNKDSVSLAQRFRFHTDTIYNFPLYYYLLSQNGCRDTLRTDLVIRKMPVAVIHTPDLAYCQKQPVPLTDSSSGEGGIGHSDWNFSDGNGDTGLSVYHRFLLPDTYRVRLITRTVYGCTDTTDSAIVVHPLPVMLMKQRFQDQCRNTNRFTFNDLSSIVYGSRSNSWRYNKNYVAGADSLSGVKFPDTGTWKVTLYNSSDQGCSDSVSVNVYVAPEPQARISVADSWPCFRGHFFNLEDAGNISRGSISQRNWSFSDGSTGAGQKISGKKFAAAGLYKATLVQVSSTYGCRDTAYRWLKVRLSPQAAFSVNDSQQCQKQNKFVFTPDLIFPAGAVTVSHTWRHSDGGTGYYKNDTHSYRQQGRYIVRHLMMTSEQCGDTFQKAVLVDSTPVAAFEVLPDSVCLGAGKIDFVNRTNYLPGFTSSWDMADGTTMGTMHVSGKAYLSAGDFKVRLVVTATNSCADTTYSVAVVLPVPRASFAVNKTVQCLQGNNFTFNNTSSVNGISGVSYQWWMQGSGFFNMKDLPSNAFADTGRYRVVLTVSSSFGCADSQFVNLLVAENPKVSISSDQPVCLGQPVNFSSLASVSSGAISSYNWDFGDGATSAQASPKHQYGTSGSFNAKCTVTSTFGCIGTAGPIPVIIHPLPKADFTWEQTDSRGMETDHQFVFTGSGASSYLWLFHDGTSRTGQGPLKITFTDTGWKWQELIVTSDMGCRDSIKRRILLKPQLQMWLPVSFTPNDDGLNEVFQPSTIFGLSNYSMMIFDRWGELMYRSQNPVQGWNGEISSREDAPEGVYAYEISFRYIDGHLYVYRGTITLLR